MASKKTRLSRRLYEKTYVFRRIFPVFFPFVLLFIHKFSFLSPVYVSFAFICALSYRGKIRKCRSALHNAFSCRINFPDCPPAVRCINSRSAAGAESFRQEALLFRLCRSVCKARRAKRLPRDKRFLYRRFLSLRNIPLTKHAISTYYNIFAPRHK